MLGILIVPSGKFSPMPYEQPGVTLSDISHNTYKERQTYKSVEVESDHEYEMLDKYNQPYEEVQVPQAPPPGDYELTQCPAYVPVTHGNQQTETSLTQLPTASSSVKAAAGVEGQETAGADKNEDDGTYEVARPC